MAVDDALASYRVTTVRVPRSRANGLWNALADHMGPDHVGRPIAFWGLPTRSVD